MNDIIVYIIQKQYLIYSKKIQYKLIVRLKNISIKYFIVDV